MGVQGLKTVLEPLVQRGCLSAKSDPSQISRIRESPWMVAEKDHLGSGSDIHRLFSGVWCSLRERTTGVL